MEKSTDQKDINHYEDLQTEYKKLFEKYEKIRKEDPQSPLLEKTVKDLEEKQKELKTTLSKLS